MASPSRSILSDDHSLERLSEGGPIIHFTSVDDLERTIQDFQDALSKDARREGLPILFQNVPYDK